MEEVEVEEDMVNSCEYGTKGVELEELCSSRKAEFSKNRKGQKNKK